MSGAWRLEAARRDLRRSSEAGLDSRALRRSFLQRLRRLIPFESAWFAMADPATLLFTDAIREEMPGNVTPLFVEDEFLRDDFNKWTELASAGSHANGLALASGGHLAASHRFREILEPLRMGDELRASLMADGRCWGFVCLHRGLGDRSFCAEEASWLAALAPTMAEGLRLSLVTQVAMAGGGEVGVVLLTEDLCLVGMSGQAERWLADIADEAWPTGKELPPVLVGAAARLRATESGAESGPPQAHVRTASGAWLNILASRISGDGESQIAVLLATVQQHLKSIFDKAGVRTRRELTAQIFGAHYQPRIKSGDSLATDGFFSP
jgi:hypothetical protein